MGEKEVSAFGLLLRQHRIRAGLTQERLAARAQMSARGLIHLERGTRRPYPDTLHRLAEALSLTSEQRDALVNAAHATDAVPSAPIPESSPQPVNRAPLFTPLPVPPTPLIGREHEVATVTALLREPGVRLVTLTGPGGTGKTRLAIAVAAALADGFADGIAFVPLAALTDPELVVPAVAAALGVISVAGESPMQGVQVAVRDRHLLFVLDNFEQVMAAAPEIADILAASQGVTVLITSRAVLRLRGEHSVAVAPLALPDQGYLPALGVLAEYAAIRLFVARAREVRSEFSLTATNAPAVAAICQQLDGLPLAIELAAARTRLLTPQALRERLEKGLGILTGGARDLPDRQRTLRGTIAWSYDLLRREEQSLLRHLGVFVGGWTLEAAEAICDPDGELGKDVLDGMEALVAQSLVRRGDESGGVPRFVFLETIREFARERLAESGAHAVMRQRHAAFFLALAEEASPHLFGAAQAAWTERLDRDLDNLRAALGWAREQGQTEIELRLAGALASFWWNRGYTREGRDWLAGAIARAGTAVVPAAVRARALCGAGQLTAVLGDQPRAVQWLRQSIALFHEAADPVGAVRALNTLGGVVYDQGDLTEAIALWEECLTLSRAANDPGEVARALGNIGEAYYHLGDLARALSCLEEAHLLARQAGRTDFEAFILGNLGNVVRRQGDMARAKTIHRQALTLKRALGARRQIAIALEDIASVAAADGHGERAARLLGAASALRIMIGTPQAAPERIATEQTVAVVRVALGEEAWAVAWAAGQDLPLEEAITDALQT